MKQEIKEFSDFLLVLFGEADGDIDRGDVVRMARDLWGWGASLRPLYVKRCNQPLSPRQITRIENLEDSAMATARALGVEVEINADDRGYPIQIKTPKTRRYNNMGGEAWGIG